MFSIILGFENVEIKMFCFQIDLLFDKSIRHHKYIN